MIMQTIDVGPYDVAGDEDRDLSADDVVVFQLFVEAVDCRLRLCGERGTRSQHQDCDLPDKLKHNAT
jgi:hypothetical protein